MADDNWYTKAAKTGWLGTKAQVSANYGSPSWKAASPKEASADSAAPSPKGDDDQMAAMKRRLAGS